MSGGTDDYDRQDRAATLPLCALDRMESFNPLLTQPSRHCHVCGARDTFFAPTWQSLTATTTALLPSNVCVECDAQGRAHEVASPTPSEVLEQEERWRKTLARRRVRFASEQPRE